MKLEKLLMPLMVSISLLSSCNNESSSNQVIEIKDYTISEDVEFGGICIHISIEEFMNKGFNYGDSIDISFSNGIEFTNMPYYDGYYVRTGDTLLVGYQGYEYVEFCKNNTSGFYDSFNFSEDTTATIKLNKKATYLVTQEALSIKYSDDRNTYSSDVEFANFRNISVGRIAPNVLYRGASPVNNSHKRAKYVDDLIQEHSIAYILDLSDKEENMNGYFAQDDFESEYAKTLYENGNITFLGLNMGYTGDPYGVTIANGLKELIKHDGPFYFHCTEGKDRTGFVAVVLEALMGATNEELEEDYMFTYKNYYGITKEKDPGKYQAIVDLRLNEFLNFFENEAIVGTLTLESKAYYYLRRGGMSEEEIDVLRDKLSTPIK